MTGERGSAVCQPKSSGGEYALFQLTLTAYIHSAPEILSEPTVIVIGAQGVPGFVFGEE